MSKKGWISSVVIGVFLFLTCSLKPVGNVSALQFLSFGTGSPAGTYYFLGAGFASVTILLRSLACCSKYSSIFQ